MAGIAVLMHALRALDDRSVNSPALQEAPGRLRIPAGVRGIEDGARAVRDEIVEAYLVFVVVRDDAGYRPAAERRGLPGGDTVEGKWRFRTVELGLDLGQRCLGGEDVQRLSNRLRNEHPGEILQLIAG